MEVSTMWLDRLPLKKDVISQYIFLRQHYESNCVSIANKSVVLMTANTVKYIWDEASVPVVTLDLVLKAVQSLLDEVCKAVLNEDSRLSRDLGRVSDLYVIYAKLLVYDDYDQSYENSLQSFMRKSNALFDVSSSEDLRDDEFFADQCNERLSRNPHLLGMKCMDGSDIYYSSVPHPKLGFENLKEHFYFQPDKLPSVLDVMKYVHSRLSNFKKSRSAGPSVYYMTQQSAINEACRQVHAIWERRFGSGSVCHVQALVAKYGRLDDSHKKLKHKNALFDIHVDILPRSDVKGRLDIESYYQFMRTDRYDKEVFSAFALPYTNSNPFGKQKAKLRAGKSLTEVFQHDVDVDVVPPSALIVPNFCELIGCDDFNGNAWLSREKDRHFSGVGPEGDWNVSGVEPDYDVYEETDAAIEGDHVTDSDDLVKSQDAFTQTQNCPACRNCPDCPYCNS